MKKIIILTNLIALMIVSACSPQQASANASSALYELPATDRLTDEYRSLLPENNTVPDRLPTTIEDPHLLAAWVYLYNQNEPITIQDGATLTGRRLAEMVIERGIPVLWGSDAVCSGNSCSERFSCQDIACVASYTGEEIDPIYISQRFQDTQAFTLARLAGSLAHELYHYTRPFGPVESSLYEEYYAFYVGTQVEKADWAVFTGYQPLKLACLMQWFRVHGRTEYFGIPAYPFTLTAQTDQTSELCAN